MSEMSMLWCTMTGIMTFFLIMKHPLYLVLTLIALTLWALLLMLMIFNLSWVSMVLFLVFLGGLLVIFTYLSALVPNETYIFYAQWLMVIMSPLITLIFMENQMKPPTQKLFITEMLSMSDTSMIPLFLVYLLTTLMVAMLMSQQLKSPLSQSNH